MSIDQPLKVAIHGSCLARDTCEIGFGDRAQVLEYVARQSIISVGVETRVLDPISDIFDSPFQRRSFRSDAHGSALERLGTHNDIDVLLLDLVDERLGVLRNGSKFVTRSVDALSHDVYVEIRWQHIPFGSWEHFKLFTEAWDKYSRQLKELELFDKAVMIQSTWATWTTEYKRCKRSMNMPTWKMNLVYEPYFSVVRQTGIPTIRAPRSLCVADPNHVWGEAPFHYTREFYDYLTNAIIKCVSP